MTNPDWLNELETLPAHHSHFGIDTDMATLTIIEQWGSYCFLSNIEDS